MVDPSTCDDARARDEWALLELALPTHLSTEEESRTENVSQTAGSADECWQREKGPENL